VAEQHSQSVTGHDDADQVLQQHTDRPAIKLAGAWRDLDAEDMLKELDRLRREPKPTPPVTSV
jgi:hypothetical protein